MLKAVQQGQLIDQDGTKGKTLRRKQPFGGNLSMSIENAFEVFIKILNRYGSQLMKGAAHLNPIIGVGIASILGGDQQAVILPTQLSQFIPVVVAIGEARSAPQPAVRAAASELARCQEHWQPSVKPPRGSRW
jgi:hypothetical protein